MQPRVLLRMVSIVSGVTHIVAVVPAGPHDNDVQPTRGTLLQSEAVKLATASADTICFSPLRVRGGDTTVTSVRGASLRCDLAGAGVAGAAAASDAAAAAAAIVMYDGVGRYNTSYGLGQAHGGPGGLQPTRTAAAGDSEATHAAMPIVSVCST